MARNRIPRTPAARLRLDRYRRSLAPRSSESHSPRRQRLECLLLVFVSLALILAGAHALFSGDLGYHNYWGGSVFAPFAIGIGVLLLLLVSFAWPRLRSSHLLKPPHRADGNGPTHGGHRA